MSDEERAATSPAEEQQEPAAADPALKAEEYLAALQRERADFLNYKRRIEQESKQVASVAAAMVVDRFLPILDDLALATAAVEPALANLPWTQGVLAVHHKLEAAFEALGVKEVEVEGKAFDPRFCEALMEGDGPANTVVKVLQRGFTMGDQLVRPARVIVGRGSGEPATDETQTSNGHQPAAEEE